jgi:bacterioferritin
VRARARAELAKGALTRSYRADPKQVIAVLNELLATELVSSLCYRRHHYTASGIASEAVKQEFLEYADAAERHADLISARIVQLNGAPDLDPATLAKRSHTDYEPGSDLVSMIKADLVAERTAIESYSEVIRWVGHDDSSTRRLLEQILERREDHAEDLASLITRLQA